MGEPLYKKLKDQLFNAPQEWELRKCSDNSCNLIWLDPMPLPDDLGNAYQTYHTHNKRSGSYSLLKTALKAVQNGYYRQIYGYQKGVGPRWHGYLSPLAYLHPFGIDIVKDGVMFLRGDTDGKKLLEVGCGNGEALKSMADKGWNVEGIDFDLNAVIQANSLALSVKHGTLADQNYSADNFDAIYLSHVLEHLPDPKDFLRECHRILKNNAKLVITTPNTNSLGHKLYKDNWRGLEPPRHLYLFNNENILKMLRESGFLRYEIKTSARGALYILKMSELLKKFNVGNTRNFSKSFSIFDKIHGYILQVYELLLMQFDSSLGEEIIVIAEK
jgi:2-polyprenyl-3-methyl-5-hydroxy-6-metoxy-1,4-benzoquinol methylase